MTAPGTPRRREEGFLVYVVVLFVVTAAALAITTRGAFQSLLKERPRGRAELQAVYAAQGGIEKARAALAMDPSWAGGTVAVGAGSATVTVEPVPGEAGLRDVVAIGSIPGPGGGSPAARMRIAARVRLGDDLPRILDWSEGAR